MLTSPHLALGFVLDKEHLELERFTREFAIVGSPETVAARIEELQKDLGFGRFNCGFGMTGRARPDQVFRSLRLFGKEVIPALTAT
jgi:alkanesulfonate monooxygenase SsuD/methylene tetrahydromethanopterin reductase-like flavin-dependent oxidoreductase (luciferase family)